MFPIKSVLLVQVCLTLSLMAFAQKPESPAKGTTIPGQISPTEAARGSDMGAVKIAKVSFAYPKDGATVTPEFVAKFSVEGMKVAKAGDMTPGTGHFHVLIDSPRAEEGVVIPADEKHLHFGQGQLEAKLKLTPGSHTLVLQFADGAHRAFSKILSQEIKITVK